MILDALARRYGCRPSEIIGLNPLSGEGVLFDLRVLAFALAAQSEGETVGGQISRKRMGWSPETKRELREQGLWH